MPQQEMLPLSPEFRGTWSLSVRDCPNCKTQTTDPGAAGGEGQRKAVPGLQVSLGSRIVEGTTGHAPLPAHAPALIPALPSPSLLCGTEPNEMDSGLPASGSLGTVINTSPSLPGKRRLCRLDPLWGLHLIFVGWGGGISRQFMVQQNPCHTAIFPGLCVLECAFPEYAAATACSESPPVLKPLAGLGFPFQGIPHLFFLSSFHLIFFFFLLHVTG